MVQGTESEAVVDAEVPAGVYVEEEKTDGDERLG